MIFTVVIDGAPEEIKPILTILHRGKKKPARKAPPPPDKKDETGSVDLDESAELEVLTNDSSGSGLPVELEEISKQRKGKA